MVRKIRRIPKAVRNFYEKEFYHQPGTLPGTIIVDENAKIPTIFLFDYNQTNCIRKQILVPEECTTYLDQESVSWVDVQGLGDQDILQRLGKVFELHPLVLEDVV